MFKEFKIGMPYNALGVSNWDVIQCLRSLFQIGMLYNVLGVSNGDTI